MKNELQKFLELPPFVTLNPELEKLQYQRLAELTQEHLKSCERYQSMVQHLFEKWQATASIEHLPFVPAPLFKFLELKSVTTENLFKVFRSSGTSQQMPSKIFLDRITALAQASALERILQSRLPSTRLPMIICDSRDVIQRADNLTARRAAVMGFMTMGRDHLFIFEEDLRTIKIQDLEQWRSLHQDQPILIFGFTHLVWNWVCNLKKQTFPKDSVAIHGGGWKHLENTKVDKETFKNTIRRVLGVENVFDYYGMIEQNGSIFLECSRGLLHASIFSRVIVRDPLTLNPLPKGKVGLLQVLSVLPTSYPGHSILTEDLGIWRFDNDCPCGLGGLAFEVKGRLPYTEMRGCSNTMQL